LNNFDVVVWVTYDYAPSENQKGQYSWVKVEDDGKISSLAVKDSNPDSNSKLLIGNFTFRTGAIAQELINELLKIRSNFEQEAYLDWVIEIALNNGFRVGAIEVRDFWAVGTPSELKTLRYWSEVFQEGRITK